jgi:hypothetical protein
VFFAQSNLPKKFGVCLTAGENLEEKEMLYVKSGNNGNNILKPKHE